MIKCCSLYSGSKGNSIYVGDENTNILIDAGTSCKKIHKGLEELDLSIENINAILVSHEHTDHILSIGTLSRKYNIPIFATKLTWDYMEQKIPNININNKFTFDPDKEFDIGNFTILPFKIPHDAVDPCGFNIYKNDYKVTIATDIGHVNNYILDKLEQSDVLVIESNYDTNMLKCSNKYPLYLKKRILGNNGHLSNDNTAALVTHLANKGMKNFILAHLSQENNFPELAYETVANSLNKIGINTELDITLNIAPRNELSTVYEL